MATDSKVDAGASPPPPTIFRKSKRRGANIRKRALEEEEANVPASDSTDHGSPSSTAPAGSSRTAKQPKLIGTASSSSALRAGNSDDHPSDTTKNDHPETTPAADDVKYHFRKAMDSTRTLACDKSEDKQEASSSKQQNDESDEKGIYKGKGRYINRAVGTGSRRTGPVKAPSNLRSTTVFDYQPNVCKDYKETGYCGYGDSCIFLHDRGSYKTGWQLEKEFEEAQQGVQRDNSRLWKAEPLSDSEDNAATPSYPQRRTKAGAAGSAELPFACLICRKPFVKPVVTKCGHYFCGACALAHYRKTPKCFACGTATAGIFNRAKDLEPKP
ncbi:RNA-splicing factor [Coemansia sp. RSA 1933]|nr:RNA-splicing factor [Coemansia sp. RSA 1933]